MVLCKVFWARAVPLPEHDVPQRLARQRRDLPPRKRGAGGEQPVERWRTCAFGVLGDRGAASLETSFAEYIAVRNCTYVKEAVGGTTLADNDKTSYIQRMLHNIDPNAQFDAFICQLSTNDASNAIPLGNCSLQFGGL